jgi:catechol 2,3-dioxygenase-like lactoylglutathione lyase family enzyme
MNLSASVINRPKMLGLSHLVIEVSDPLRAQAFYSDILGLAEAPEDHWPTADERAFLLSSGQWLVFRHADEPRIFADSGVHQAYRCTLGAIDNIAARLTNDGITVHRYHEDRPAEANDGFYFSDPDGNRIQLVTGNGAPEGAAIDHAGVLASDMEWEDAFFIDQLGFPIDHAPTFRFF